MKTEIKQKFGTIKSFTDFAGINPNQMIAFLNNRMSNETKSQFEQRIRNIIESAPIDFKPINLITDDEREMIRQFVAINYKSIRSFCKQHPEFTLTFISNIITGRKKTKEKRWHKLIDVIQTDAKLHTFA